MVAPLSLGLLNTTHNQCQAALATKSVRHSIRSPPAGLAATAEIARPPLAPDWKRARACATVRSVDVAEDGIGVFATGRMYICAWTHDEEGPSSRSTTCDCSTTSVCLVTVLLSDFSAMLSITMFILSLTLSLSLPLSSILHKLPATFCYRATASCSIFYCIYPFAHLRMPV
ncbi:hypothetical protein BAUCODRAFT_332647 [Baudoinia panamericana UAMH 10762]|uniref:Uncharacterized protein n=1 Tax=Baudoinia panamericana (strain UAMH 10762) TaxID=717646 RepID=M2LAY6_BAUPA|nr:uncharacterized protein BAUCODRAFT_332647 [Baudoinia panamericana UAMH 10762]EMC90977.1 hypothetical protein BAUCODRAFT_332647 [Baudoinia panamericana UAMH 10762]